MVADNRSQTPHQLNLPGMVAEEDLDMQKSVLFMVVILVATALIHCPPVLPADPAGTGQWKITASKCAETQVGPSILLLRLSATTPYILFSFPAHLDGKRYCGRRATCLRPWAPRGLPTP